MDNKSRMTDIVIVALLPIYFLAFSSAVSIKIGVNYGRLGNNLPSPLQSIGLIRNMKVGSVKIYDANPEILTLLSGTKLQVSIMVPNDQISTIASSQAAADQWVRENVLAHYPNTQIRFILVGNEVLSYNTTPEDRQRWHSLVPAIQNIKSSLRVQNIRNIKVGTPLAMDVMGRTFPPSSGTFRPEVTDVIVPLLHYLNGTKSFFFVDVYPYFPWSENPTGMSLDHALFSGGNSTSYTDPDSGLTYTNLLDQMLDSVVFAMAKLGYQDVKLGIAETGWPNAGDIDQPGANVYNAATYNRNLVRRMTARPVVGTPARPGMAMPIFIFSLFDENQKFGSGTERHWGLLHPDGTPVYELDFMGRKTEAGNNGTYRGNLWCVVADGVKETDLGSAISFACGRGNGTCDALAPGKECYEPISATSHASYAFSSYWAKFRNDGATCNFNGLAAQVMTDPSHGSCKFPSTVTIS